MKFNILLITGIILLTPVWAGAQMYKYYDENNQLSFTDDYSKIPMDQRPDVQTIPEARMPQQETTQPASGQDLENAQQQTEAARIQEFEELSRLKKKFEKQHSELKATHETLSSFQGKPAIADEVTAYNQKTEEYNQQLIQYKKEYQSYLDRVKNYNKNTAAK